MKEFTIKITDTDVYINGKRHLVETMDKEDAKVNMDKKALVALADEMGYETVFLFEEMADRFSEMLDELDAID